MHNHPAASGRLQGAHRRSGQRRTHRRERPGQVSGTGAIRDGADSCRDPATGAHDEEPPTPRMPSPAPFHHSFYLDEKGSPTTNTAVRPLGPRFPSCAGRCQRGIPVLSWKAKPMRVWTIWNVPELKTRINPNDPISGSH
jgi:hypothetical protein